MLFDGKLQNSKMLGRDITTTKDEKTANQQKTVIVDEPNIQTGERYYNNRDSTEQCTLSHKGRPDEHAPERETEELYNKSIVPSPSFPSCHFSTRKGPESDVSISESISGIEMGRQVEKC